MKNPESLSTHQLLEVVNNPDEWELNRERAQSELDKRQAESASNY